MTYYLKQKPRLVDPVVKKKMYKIVKQNNFINKCKYFYNKCVHKHINIIIIFLIIASFLYYRYKYKQELKNKNKKISMDELIPQDLIIDKSIFS